MSEPLNSGKVIRLGATDDSTDLIPTLLDLLERARTGELTFISGFGITKDDEDKTVVRAYATTVPASTSMLALRGAAEFSHEALCAWMRN